MRYRRTLIRLRIEGFTYVGLLLMVVLIGVGLAAVANVWHTESQRAKEAELLFVGHQFRDAIKRYYNASPGRPELPKSFEDLLQDKRFPTVRRYLRKLFVDPMTGKAEWGLVMVGDRIVGVHSLSKGRPFKVRGFTAVDAGFEEKTSYDQWMFVFENFTDQSAALVATPQAQRDSEPSTEPLDKPSECAAQRARDIAACGSVTARDGPLAGGGCNLSAGRRYTACLTGAGN
jgi:type II secretory pathway pseudopilin PulG